MCCTSVAIAGMPAAHALPWPFMGPPPPPCAITPTFRIALMSALAGKSVCALKPPCCATHHIESMLPLMLPPWRLAAHAQRTSWRCTCAPRATAWRRWWLTSAGEVATSPWGGARQPLRPSGPVASPAWQGRAWPAARALCAGGRPDMRDTARPRASAMTHTRQLPQPIASWLDQVPTAKAT